MKLIDVEDLLRREVKRLLKLLSLPYNSIKVLSDDGLTVVLDVRWDHKNNLTLTYSEYLRFMSPEEIISVLKEEVEHYRVCLQRRSQA